MSPFAILQRNWKKSKLSSYNHTRADNDLNGAFKGKTDHFLSVEIWQTEYQNPIGNHRLGVGSNTPINNNKNVQICTAKKKTIGINRS